jgi:hypothetical protein
MDIADLLAGLDTGRGLPFPGIRRMLPGELESSAMSRVAQHHPYRPSPRDDAAR